MARVIELLLRCVLNVCILVRHDGVANDFLALVLGVGQGNSLASDGFVQGSLYPFPCHYHLRERLSPSIAMKDRQGRAIVWRLHKGD